MEEGEEVKEVSLKMLVVGSSAVGKTSLTLRLTNDVFRTDYKSTIGVDFGSKCLNLSANLVAKCQLWDVAGSERFQTLTRVYCDNAVGAIVVFDSSADSRQASLQRALDWRCDLHQNVFLRDGSTPIPCILVAAKSDTIPRDEMDSFEKNLTEIAKKNGFVASFVTSAKDNFGVLEMLRFFAAHCLQLVSECVVVEENEGFKLVERPSVLKEKRKCGTMQC